MTAVLLWSPAIASTAWAGSQSKPGGRYIITDTNASNSAGAASQVGGVGGPVLESLSDAQSVVSNLNSSQASTLSSESGVTLT
ncbi:MAG: hypothetical protein ACRDV4_10145, partial [Acidimicrobiales bacterium]